MSYTSALVWQMAAQSQVRALLTAVFFLFWIWRLPFQAPDRPFQRHRRGQQCPLPLGLRSAGPLRQLQELRRPLSCPTVEPDVVSVGNGQSEPDSRGRL